MGVTVPEEELREDELREDELLAEEDPFDEPPWEEVLECFGKNREGFSPFLTRTHPVSFEDLRTFFSVGFPPSARETENSASGNQGGSGRVVFRLTKCVVSAYFMKPTV
jgi:hypothetical protein